MKRRSSAAGAVALSCFVIATGPALADQRQQVDRYLAENSIETANSDALTNDRVSQIQLVLNNDTRSDTEKMAQIERILAVETTMNGSLALRSEVARSLSKVNADVDVTELTPDQLVQIELVAGGTESETSKREMIEAIAEE